MNARNKLNRLHILGNLALAGLVGGVFASWPVFLLVLAALFWASLASDEIRPDKPNQQPTAKRWRRKGRKHGP